MDYFFNAGEIFQTAILIEQNGIKFYQRAADETKDKSVKEICLKLRDAEKQHEQTFRKLLQANLAKKPAVVAVKDSQVQDLTYLKSLADANVFARALTPSEIAAKVKTDQETLRFGMKVEQESITFYAQIKKFTRPDWGLPEVDKIILEEQEHYKTLNKLLEDKINPRETC